MPADDNASRSRRAVATEISSSCATSAAVTRPRACISNSTATNRSARTNRSSQTNRSPSEHLFLARFALADLDVNGLTDQIGVTGVPGVLLDEVGEQPPQIRRTRVRLH